MREFGREHSAGAGRSKSESALCWLHRGSEAPHHHVSSDGGIQQSRHVLIDQPKGSPAIAEEGQVQVGLYQRGELCRGRLPPDYHPIVPASLGRAPEDFFSTSARCGHRNGVGLGGLPLRGSLGKRAGGLISRECRYDRDTTKGTPGLETARPSVESVHRYRQRSASGRSAGKAHRAATSRLSEQAWTAVTEPGGSLAALSRPLGTPTNSASETSHIILLFSARFVRVRVRFRIRN